MENSKSLFMFLECDSEVGEGLFHRLILQTAFCGGSEFSLTLSPPVQTGRPHTKANNYLHCHSCYSSMCVQFKLDVHISIITMKLMTAYSLEFSNFFRIYMSSFVISAIILNEYQETLPLFNMTVFQCHIQKKVKKNLTL